MKKNTKAVFFLLLLLNILLFYKLKYFIPQLTGSAQLLDLKYYYDLAGDIWAGINPYTVSYTQTLGPPTVFFYFLFFSVFNINTGVSLYFNKYFAVFHCVISPQNI
jgi:hypothetical protein